MLSCILFTIRGLADDDMQRAVSQPVELPAMENVAGTVPTNILAHNLMCCLWPPFIMKVFFKKCWWLFFIAVLNILTVLLK